MLRRSINAVLTAFFTIVFSITNGLYAHVSANQYVDGKDIIFLTSDSVGFETEEIEVTASMIRTPLLKASRIIGIMTQEQISEYPVQSVNDILKYAVGVDVRQRGPMGAQTDIGIRGGNFEQVAILLDGINICDPQTGHNSFDFPVDMSDIDHIELLEGPAGRAYGSCHKYRYQDGYRNIRSCACRSRKLGLCRKWCKCSGCR